MPCKGPYGEIHRKTRAGVLGTDARKSWPTLLDDGKIRPRPQAPNHKYSSPILTWTQVLFSDLIPVVIWLLLVVGKEAPKQRLREARKKLAQLELLPRVCPRRTVLFQIHIAALTLHFSDVRSYKKNAIVDQSPFMKQTQLGKRSKRCSNRKRCLWHSRNRALQGLAYRPIS